MSQNKIIDRRLVLIEAIKYLSITGSILCTMLFLFLFTRATRDRDFQTHLSSPSSIDRTEGISAYIGDFALAALMATTVAGSVRVAFLADCRGKQIAKSRHLRQQE